MSDDIATLKITLSERRDIQKALSKAGILAADRLYGALSSDIITIVVVPIDHDYTMPHSIRYSYSDSDTSGCPPNCPARKASELA
jgi:hypothetical protein